MVTEDQSYKRLSLVRWHDDQYWDVKDKVVVEKPLQISLRHGRQGSRKNFVLAITMRTPGDDETLVHGFLYGENIIHDLDDVLLLRQISDDHVLVELAESVQLDADRLQRNIYSNSSCGACGKTNLEQLDIHIPWLPLPKKPSFTQGQISSWLKLIKGGQSLFALTGGNHAVALFNTEGLVDVMEDVGRHNAMDKLIGKQLLRRATPLRNHAVVVSGRASFELVQKTLMAGISVLAAVGAPSSLAVETAQGYGMTLIGFLKDRQYNIYHDMDRIIMDD